MSPDDPDDVGLRTAALRTSEAIVVARQRAERDLLEANEALERRTDELQQQREQFEVTLASIGDAVITTDTAGRVTFLNAIAEDMTGWTSAEAQGESIDRVFHIVNEADRRPAVNPVRKVLDTGRNESLANHTALISRSGAETAIEDSAAPIRGKDGTIRGVVMVFHDVSSRRAAESALLAESRRLELLNETGIAIASQLETKALLQTVTDAATRLSGGTFGVFFYARSGDEPAEDGLLAVSGVPPHKLAALARPGDAPYFDPTFGHNEILRLEDAMTDPRFAAAWSGDGRDQPALRSYLAVPVALRDGTVIGGLLLGHPDAGIFTEQTQRLVAGIAVQAAVGIENARLYELARREIANREKAEEAMHEADRRKDEFLATLAHELRNPLAPIRQAALISRITSATEAQKRWSHEVIDRQVQHMALLLDDLLDISRVTRGTLELRTELADLAAIVDAAVETARPVIDAKRHELVIEMPSVPITVTADPLRLAQVLSNILTNAAKYSDPQGRIHLRGSRTGDTIVISIADTGIGIPADAIEGVFAMFSQVKTGQDRSEGGLGIGLALARGLVELHGGTIEARSDGPGRGSEFIVQLPNRAPAVAAAARPAAPGTGSPTRARRVLIADDNGDAAESLALLLRLEGHEVTVARDGAAALAALQSLQPEIAILDIGMPELSGYEVAREVRRGTLGRAVTLIAVTGWGQDRDKADALAAGFNHHFTKPVNPDDLLELLRTQS